MVTGTSNTIKVKPAIVRRAKIQGVAETARRLGRSKPHVYYVLAGLRPSPHADEYRRVHDQVLQDAGFTPAA